MSSTPFNEACDSVSGRALFVLKTKDFLKLSLPWSRPLSVSLGIQGALNSWKFHIARGVVLGECSINYKGFRHVETLYQSYGKQTLLLAEMNHVIHFSQ